MPDAHLHAQALTQLSTIGDKDSPSEPSRIVNYVTWAGIARHIARRYPSGKSLEVEGRALTLNPSS